MEEKATTMIVINPTNFMEIIENIREIHQTSVDQRSKNFQEYLIELFQSISLEQLEFFRLLRRFLADYDDRAALKMEFFKANCLEKILKLFNPNETHLTALFEFLLEFLHNSETIQEEFLHFNGYEKFFPYLRYISSPNSSLLNQFFLLMIDRPFTLSFLPIDSFVRLINPQIAVVLIEWIPYLINSTDQEYILLSMERILLCSLQNKMLACSNGILRALLKLFQTNRFDEKIQGDIFSLTEHLAQFSINAQEIRLICQLFQGNSSLKKSLLQLLIIAAKHNDPDGHAVSSYFDFQRSNSGILLPMIRQWPSIPSNHFSFHCWIRLNHEIHSYPYEGRRQIYSFYSDSIGLEAFLRQSSIFILISDQREIVYVELNDCEDLIDGYWHSLTIVHTAQRPSLFVSAFSSTLTCHLTISIDGLLRKEVKDLKYVPIVSDPMKFSSIASPSQRPRESNIRSKQESLSASLSKTIQQPFKGLFSSKTKQSIPRKDLSNFSSPHIIVIDPNSQDSTFGPSITLYGQLACIWIVAETLNEFQVKHLHEMGADFLHQTHPSHSGDDAQLSSILHEYLLTRSLLAYHPSACDGQICIDISGSSPSLQGRLINSSSSHIHSFSQTLFQLGGCSILYSLIESFDETDYDQSNEILPSDENQYTNPIASIISLIRYSLSSRILTEQLTKHWNVEILAEFLKRMSNYFLDAQFLLAIEQLIEFSRSMESSSFLTTQLIEHILFDFQLWNQSDSSLQILHLQTLSKIIKEDRHIDREKFGVQFFLDILKEHFNSSTDQQQLRSIIYTIIKFLLQTHIRMKDLNSILSSIATVSLVNNSITHELLDLIHSLLDMEMIVDYLCESNMIEGFYSLLILNNLSSETKEIIFKIINFFLGSKRVSIHTKTLLKLEANHIGFGGIVSGMTLNDLNQSMVEQILQIIITSNTSTAVHHLNTVLTLCSAASIDVRYITIRKLMKYFLEYSSACRLYGKCHGWQETLAHFFVRNRRPSTRQSLPADVLLATMKDQNFDSNSRQTILTNLGVNKHRPSLPISMSRSTETLDDTGSEKANPKSDSVNTSTDNLSSTAESFGEFHSYPLERNMTPPQSIADSREDLLSSLKRENSHDNLNRIHRVRSSVPATLLRAAINTRIATSESSRFYLRPSVDIVNESLLEEMTETLILVIVMILWKGITDSDEAAWMTRAQIFSTLRHLRREYDLYLPLDIIERRILELSMEACLNDAKVDKVKQNPAYENNCQELIKLVHDFLSQPSDNSERITENLVNGILPILDTTLIFKKHDSTPHSPSHDHWSETSLMGLNILLALLADSSISHCSQASIRIHSLLTCRVLNGREEAAYLFSRVARIYLSLSNPEASERDAHLLPLMKIILDKSAEFYAEETSMTDLFAHNGSIGEFCQYVTSMKREDWRLFVEQITEPYADHYRSMSIRPLQMNMEIWWNDCHEKMSNAVHQRNRQIGEEKSKFQNHIVQPWQQRIRSEDQRIIRLNEQRRIHRIDLQTEWKNRKKYLYGERGVWFNENNPPQRYWMLSNHENVHRMRCKLVENEHFNEHEESSRLRDNLSIEKQRNFEKGSMKIESKDNSLDENPHMEISHELGEEKEKIILESQCSLITPTSIIDGEFFITDKHIYFFDSARLKTCQNDLKYPLNWLQDVQLRRYNLRPTALEFFLINQRNFLVNFDQNPSNLTKKTRRQIFHKLISLKLPSMKSTFSNLGAITSPQEMLKELKITEKWITREMSNFDYLMMLNTIAGRTYNDLNQYPIFPWVIKDYSSQVLDLNNPEVFRDFSRPIGVQNPKHIEEVKFKYESFDDPTGLIKKFHYGTHYSNGATVMHYLIRMEPFTTLHIQLQSGKFDIADRQFHSFQSSWSNIMDSPNDGKELIPEFFYLPEFLVNSNRFDLGKLQSNNQYLNDVQLPPWAQNSPEEFIRLHRIALESDYVSAHLHKWIDLIFGYKQSGQAAIDALNVFMYCSYEEGIDSDMIDDLVTRDAIDGMIQNFGQIPSQLLTEPHPQRQSREQATLLIESQGRALNIFQNLEHIKAFFVELTSSLEKATAPIIFLTIPKNQIRSFMQQGTPDMLVTISANGVVGNNGWHPYGKSSNNVFTFERDPTLPSERNRLTTIAPFSPLIGVTSRLFTVSYDGRFIFSGGHWDRSLRIYSLHKSKTINSVIGHTDIITCLALDSTGFVLVTGSRDCTCVIWHLSLSHDHDIASFIHPQRTLHGHTDEISCVCVSSELDLVVSGSFDGTCNIHTIEHGIYLRTLRPTIPLNHPIVNLKLSDERHILIQVENDQTHLFLYSINGHLIRTRRFDYSIVDVLISDQYIIIAVNHNQVLERSAVASRVIIKDLFQMATIQTIRIRAQINCLFLTKDSSHLLASVKDGKLFVLTPAKKDKSKKPLKT